VCGGGGRGVCRQREGPVWVGEAGRRADAHEGGKGRMGGGGVALVGGGRADNEADGAKGPAGPGGCEAVGGESREESSR